MQSVNLNIYHQWWLFSNRIAACESIYIEYFTLFYVLCVYFMSCVCAPLFPAGGLLKRKFSLPVPEKWHVNNRFNREEHGPWHSHHDRPELNTLCMVLIIKPLQLVKRGTLWDQIMLVAKAWTALQTCQRKYKTHYIPPLFTVTHFLELQIKQRQYLGTCSVKESCWCQLCFMFNTNVYL